MNKSDFDIDFQQAFLGKKGDEFERWFAAMASKVYGTDFEQINAGGKDGDKKCDGRLISQDIVFQCYAPESPAAFAKNAAKKIENSFPAVTEYWPNLKTWIFVHNSADGLPSSASDKIEEIRGRYKNINITTATRDFLKDELHNKLTLLQLLDVYRGLALNFGEVRMEHLRPLLNKIIEGRRDNPNPQCFGDIPDATKLDFNELGYDAKWNINRARPYVDLVKRYLDSLSKPQHVTTIQSEIINKYEELKSFEYVPDEIIGKLVFFCSNDDTAPSALAAAYVIVTYYFDACDIFENTPSC